MNVDIETAVDGCATYCPKFEVTVINLFENDNIIHRIYRCEHLEECNAMLEAMQTITIKMENIT